MRALILLHRYLGIAIGLVMALWCASGFVMMYVGYPSLDGQERIAALEPLNLGAVTYDKVSGALGVEAFDNFAVEMVAGRAILRAKSAGPGSRVIDLSTGESINAFNQTQATSVADHAPEVGSLIYLGAIERDQWTVSGQFNRDRPLHHIALGDNAGTEIYVSSTTGAMVQKTTQSERFWNWLGAVPHWLYPTVLRQHAQLWSQVVVWLSLAGMFLTVIGLYIGIDHWRAMKGSKLSPYRGVPLWHHLSGLFFGVLTLTWVGSGWVSMSPWGLFEGGDFREERDQVRDFWIGGSEINAALEGISKMNSPSPIVRIESAPFDGKLFLLIHSRTDVVRVDAATLRPVEIERSQVERGAKKWFPSNRATVDLLAEGDSYYYSGHDPRSFPVYRIALDDKDRTRYYLDARSGDLIDKIDPARRSYRWFFEGLHRFDFFPALRTRPWWDLLVLTLIAGVTVLSFTGVWMGWKRLRS